MTRDQKEKELKELMLLSLEGDKVAYEKFLKEVNFLLKSFLHKTLGSKQKSKIAVDDLIQDTLISIHKKRDLFKKDMAVLPWIFSIARYRMIDVIRSESRRPTHEWNYESEYLTATEFQEHMPASGEELLEGISVQNKEILLMAKVEDIPLAEIAEKKNISLSAVKVSIHRSLNTIRKRLQNDKGSGGSSQ